MPHIWNNIAVVTLEELKPWFSYSALQKHIKRHEDKNYGIKKARCGGSGRQMLLTYESLPAEIKAVLKDPNKLDHILSLYYKTDSEAVTFFQSFQFDDGSFLSLQHQEQYITNASTIQTLIKMREARIAERRSKGGAVKKGLMASLLNDAKTFNPVLEINHKVKHTLPSSEKRFKQALTDFEKHGYKSLISKRHRNTNSKKMTDDLLGLLNSMFATDSTKPTRTEVAKRYDAFLGGYYQVINQDSGEVYDPKDFKSLTTTTIVSWLGKWDQRIATYYMRGGARKDWMQQFQPSHKLRRPKYAGSIISVDDRNPPFHMANKKRAWFYLAIDLASEVFTTNVFGKSKDLAFITEFYRQMVRDYHEYGLNLPAELEAESSLNATFKNGLLLPGRMFEHVRIESNNPRGKRIERYFLDLRYGMEKEQDAWVARPFARSESNQAFVEKTPELPYSTIGNNGLRTIARWNNQPHSKYPSISRWDWHLENQNPNLKPTNYRGIIPFIGDKTTTTCNAGTVRFQYGEFVLAQNGTIALGAPLINLLAKLEDNRFDVYWLNGNDNKLIKAYAYIGDQYICELLPKPTYSRATVEQTEEDYRNRETMSHYVNTIIGYKNSKKGSIDMIYTEDNRVREVNQNFKIRGLDGELLSSSEDEDYTNTEVETLPQINEDEQHDYIPKTDDYIDRF